MARRSRGHAPRRHIDWSGVFINDEVTVANAFAEIPIWTPISEDKKATVV